MSTSSCAASPTTARTSSSPRLHQGGDARPRRRISSHRNSGRAPIIDIHLALERQIEAERWTQLDRQLVRDAIGTASSTWRRTRAARPDEFHALKVGRLRKLESLGLADQVGPGQWMIATRPRDDACGSSASAATSSNACTAASPNAASSADRRATCSPPRASTRPSSAGWSIVASTTS